MEEALFLQMVAIAESTGNLGGTFAYLSEMYEEEIGDLTKNLTTMIEPILMIIMGLIVGFNKRFLRFSSHPVRLYGTNETCFKLLKTKGVARLVEFVDNPVRFPEPLERLGSGRKAGAGMVLKAHEELMELSEENERKFSALRTILGDAAKEEAGED